jgi:1-acyl-sn-glycerol-3-phosphate acyltransferase
MLWFRLARVALHLFAGLATCAFIFPLVGHARKQALIGRWSVKLVALCGVKVVVRHADGAQPAPRALMVANHISWIDIFVINSMQVCRFVAKSDIRDWPLIGWLCEKSDTIFISRGSRRDVKRIYQGIVASLHDGEHVAFFPEGTTSSQGQLLPFHANLFEAAIEADVPVQPYVLRYLDAQGGFHPAAEFIGDTTFAQSMITILKSRGMKAELVVLPVIATGEESHRRELAEVARQKIAAALQAA